jgi:sugar/nucleoside kinase (ribokinase family)
MSYERLHRRLTESDRCTVVALPDGSIDTDYRVVGGRDNVLETREEFIDWMTDPKTSSCRLVRRTERMGGQAVNTARQCFALGDDVTLYGHLEDPIFDSLPFETRSMGEPARVMVFDFEDDKLMMAETSSDIRSWSISDLYAHPGADATLQSADGILLANWVSFPEMDRVLCDLADRALGSATVVFDPGDLTESGPDAIGELAASLRRLAGAQDVVLSVNEDEMAYVLDAIEVDGASMRERVGALRADLELLGAVIHDADYAFAATATGRRRVPNLAARRIRRRAGAGDRFNGGLLHGLGVGWDWGLSLALGNACASYYVENGQTGARGALRSFLKTRIDDGGPSNSR